MKRRGFLSMLGGAFAAPLMPSVSLGAASKAAYPASALHAAIFHAKARVNFSVFSLSRTLGVDLGQAEQIMTDMSARGILGPLQGTTQSGRWALSRVWERPIVDAAMAQKAARSQAKANRKSEGPRKSAQSGSTTPDTLTPQSWSEPGMRPVLTHLYDLCRAQGRTLHPRCAQLVA